MAQMSGHLMYQKCRQKFPDSVLGDTAKIDGSLGMRENVCICVFHFPQTVNEAG